TFLFQQSLFTFHAPAITRKASVQPQHPVTRNRDRNSIRSARTSHSANGFGEANALRDFAVSGGGPGGNFLQRFPDTTLESRAAHVERKFQAEAWRVHKTNHRRNHSLELFVATDQLRLRKTILKIFQ